MRYIDQYSARIEWRKTRHDYIYRVRVIENESSSSSVPLIDQEQPRANFERFFLAEGVLNFGKSWILFFLLRHPAFSGLTPGTKYRAEVAGLYDDKVSDVVIAPFITSKVFVFLSIWSRTCLSTRDNELNTLKSGSTILCHKYLLQHHKHNDDTDIYPTDRPITIYMPVLCHTSCLNL